MPTAKLTTQTITALIVSVITGVLLHVFAIELTGAQVTMIGGVVGWAVGAVAAYFVTETNPPPSSYPHLPPEVAPPQQRVIRR